MSHNERKRTTRLLLPDADVLGFAVATFVAGAVAAFGLFRLQLTAFETLLRAGLTFVVTYAAVFMLVKYIVWAMLTEIASKRRREFEIQRQALAAQNGHGSRPPEQEPGEAGK
ncbi:MAG: hypothetical protein NTZ09_20635 [Candidatus Hydrogenedentes bacterium]|nr:hypothetical protein [Candidatus Hydrogenedentota bacterium]